MNPATANIYITATNATKKAFDDIKTGALVLGGALLGIGVAANASLEKFAALNDFDNFNVPRESALAYIDVLKLSGGTIENVGKSFEDLSVKVSTALGDEKLRTVFKEMGVDAKDLKNAKIDEIMDKVFDSAAKTEDKARALKNLKEIFGKNGILIFDAAQEERAVRIRDGIKKVKDEVDFTSAGADELYKGLSEIKGMAENGLSRAFAVPLVGLNALLETVIETGREMDKAKTKAELINEAKVFKDMALEMVDFANVMYDGIRRGIIILDALKDGFMIGLKTVKLFGDTIGDFIIQPLRDAANVAQGVFSALYEGATGNFEQAKIDMSKALNFTNTKGAVDRFNGAVDSIVAMDNGKIKEKLAKAFFSEPEVMIDPAKFSKNYDKMLQKTIDAMGQGGKGGDDRKAGGLKVEMFANVESAIKNLDKLLELSKMYNEDEARLNELLYSDKEKVIADFFAEKRRLEEEAFNNAKKTYEAELKLIETAIGAGIPQKDLLKAKEKQLEIQNKLIKAELDYNFGKKKSTSEEKKATEEYTRGIDEIRAKLYELRGEFGEAQKIRIKIETDKGMEGVDPKDKEEVANYYKKKDALDQIEASFKKVNLQAEYRGAMEASYNQLAESGSMDLFEANRKILELRQADIGLLEKQIALLKQKAAEDPTDMALQAKLINAETDFRKFKENVDPIAKQINDSLDGAFSTFAKDILDSNKSVADSFKNLFKSIEQEIMSLIVKNLSKKLMNSLFDGATGGSGGVGGFFSSMMGGGSGGGATAPASTGGGATGGGGGIWDMFANVGSWFGGLFAEGGRPPLNKVSIVGEREPELFVPHGLGDIVPMSKMGKGGGNNQPIVNVTVMANDIEQFRSTGPQLAKVAGQYLGTGGRNK